jgi:CheY-like chemotaxis protein
VTRPGQPDRRTVLVVDGDDLVRWSAAEGLKECRYSAEVAANAAEALEYCREAAVALVDHDLPEVDGLALADTLRRRCPRCAIVLMTADPTPELHREARRRGIVRVLDKPFSLEVLVDAIREASGHSPPSLPARSGPDDTDDDGPCETGAAHSV